MRFLMLRPGTEGSAQRLQATCSDGRLDILVGVEPFNDDGTFGLHVCVGHRDRLPTNDEVKMVGDKLFGRTPYNEETPVGSKQRHLWETMGILIA